MVAPAWKSRGICRVWLPCVIPRTRMGSKLIFEADQWLAFTGGVKAGAFDLA